MKKQIKYRPRSLSKEEKEYLKRLERRELIMALLAIIAGALVLYAIYNMAKAAAGL